MTLLSGKIFFKENKFSIDLVWNIIGFAVTAVCGLVLFFLIARLYSKEALGVFNQVYAVFIFFSQLAVFGIHFSVGEAIPKHLQDRDQAARITGSACLVAAVWSSVIVMVVLRTSGWIGALLDSPGIGIGIIYCAAGLWFFSLNKILLAVLNGYRYMRAFAVLNAARSVLLLFWFLILWQEKGCPKTIPVIFPLGEMTLLGILIAVMATMRIPISLRGCGDWMRRHVVFGLKGFLSGALTELNTRIDVLLLGFFSSDALVGVYSLGAGIAEGLLQILYVARLNVNPVLAQRSFFDKEGTGLIDFLDRGVRVAYRWSVPLLLGGAAAGTLVLFALFPGPDAAAAAGVLWIIVSITAGVCGYLPFLMLPVQQGRPGYFTLLMAGAVGAAAIVDYALIPVIGLYGAAAGAGLSFVTAVFLLKVYIRTKTGWTGSAL